MSNLVLSDTAKADLDEIWLYIAEDSPEMATKFISRILDKCRFLAELPEIGTLRPDILEGMRSFPLGNYLIFYQPAVEGRIEIARVINAKRDIPAVFREFWDK